MGLPCGHVVGSPSRRLIDSSTFLLMTCSHLPASWCASAQDSLRTSVRKRSAMRCLRTTRWARALPASVRAIVPSCVTRPSTSSFRIISLTAGRLTCNLSAMRAWMTSTSSSSSSKMHSQYSSKAGWCSPGAGIRRSYPRPATPDRAAIHETGERSPMSATLALDAVTVSRADRRVLDQVDLLLAPGHRIGVVGPNGVGKSTLLAVCAQAVRLDRGRVRLAPPTATVGWLHQEPERSDETVEEFLARRTGVTDAQRELDAATAALAVHAVGAAERYDTAWNRWLALGAADLDARIGAVADELGMNARLLAQPTASLSGGEAARASLAALLLSRFDVYLLDEPTNDLDLDGLARLERWVIALEAGVLLVSHDRTFLDRVVTDVVEIDEFTHGLTPFGGGWEAYLAERSLARQHARERFEEYDTTRKGLAERAQRQREWAQQGVARVKRSMNDEPDKNIRRFRVNQTEQLAGKAAQTQRAIDRLDAVAKPREPWQLQLEVPHAGRSGDVVARLDGVTVERGSFRLGPIDLLVEYGERIALVGRNGSGKSTL